MRAFGLCLALMFLPASAQSYMMTSTSKSPQTWSEWKGALRRSGQPAWVVLEDPRRPMASSLLSVLNQEPLLSFDYQMIQATLEGPMGHELRGAFGWEGPCWGVVSPRGELLVSGPLVPTATELLDRLKGAGIQSKLEVLEAFIRRYPDHLEAREAFLGELLNLGCRRMFPLVKEGASEKGGGRDSVVELRAPLSDEDDARIWANLAAGLEPHLLSGDYQRTHGWSLWGLDMGVVRHSRLMQAVALKALPMVEEALRQSPSHNDLWDWWLRLSGLAGGRPLRPLLESLVLAPGENRGTIPPPQVVARYLQNARASARWDLVKELLQPRWEAQLGWVTQITGMDANGKPMEDGLGMSWDSLTGPLLEAHLRSGDTQAADQLVQDINAWQPGSVSLPRRAAAMATTCGYPDLAARWGALKVVPKS